MRRLQHSARAAGEAENQPAQNTGTALNSAITPPVVVATQRWHMSFVGRAHRCQATFDFTPSCAVIATTSGQVGRLPHCRARRAQLAKPARVEIQPHPSRAGPSQTWLPGRVKGAASKCGRSARARMSECSAQPCPQIPITRSPSHKSAQALRVEPSNSPTDASMAMVSRNLISCLDAPAVSCHLPPQRLKRLSHTMPTPHASTAPAGPPALTVCWGKCTQARAATKHEV